MRGCGKDVTGRDATVDHIDPNGSNESSNLALLCRSCNSTKRDGDLDRWAAILNRKSFQRRIEDVLTPMVERLVWADSPVGVCPQCGIHAPRVGNIEVAFSFVWHCRPCRLYFKVSAIDGLGEFIEDVRASMWGAWWAKEETSAVVKTIGEGQSLAYVESLVASCAGDIEGLKRLRHRHAKGACWCEFGGDGFEFTGKVYPQSTRL